MHEREQFFDSAIHTLATVLLDVTNDTAKQDLRNTIKHLCLGDVYAAIRCLSWVSRNLSNELDCTAVKAIQTGLRNM